jgi:YVTN family beta-propeller protein
MKKWGIWTVVLLVLLLVGGCGQKESVQRTTPTSSNNITKNRDGSLLYIANIDVNTVSVLDTKQNKVIAEIPVGREPRQLALSPDDRVLYVTCMFDNKVDIIDTADKKVTGSVPVGIEPFGVVVNRDGSQVYVANYRSSTVSVIDAEERKVTGTINVEERPRGLAMTAEGNKLYVTHYLSGHISVINTEENQVKKVIALSPSPDKEDRKKSQGIPNTVEQFVIAPDGKTAWVPHLLTNVDTPIHFEETVFPAISVIDVTKDEEIQKERKELFKQMDVRDVKNETIIVSNPTDVAFLPDGSKAFVLMAGSEDLMVFDLTRGGNATQLVRRVPGNNPRGMVLSNDSNRLYIHNAMSHDMAIVETGGNDPYAEAQAKPNTLRLIAKDSLPPLVRQGKTIFFSGNSDEFAAPITGNNWMSCASCHADGDINGLTLMTPRGPRNVPSNVLAMRTGLFMWDGSRDDFTDYLLTVQGEMGGLTDYDPGKPLPPKVEEMFDALKAYLEYPDSFPVPKSPYRNPDGTLTAKAEQGKQLFEGKAGCIACHAGETMTDSTKAVNATGKLTTDNTKFLHDVGTVNPLDKGTKGDARAGYTNPRSKEIFDTPTLRGVWATAPYLHDGSAKTIYDVLTTRNQQGKHGNTSALTEAEKRALVEYVNSIE